MGSPISAQTFASMRRIPLFSTLGAADLRELATACRTMRLPAGTTLFSPEDAADCFYVILTGRVKIFQLSPNGDEQILHLYGPGGTFGEAAMWAGTRYPAHAEAVTETTLLAVSRTALKDAVSRKPEVALEMMAGMSRKLREFNELIEQLSLKEVPARLARVLLQLHGEEGSPTIRLGQTKRELASQIGTSPETLSRSLAKLKSAGLIEVRGPVVRILDPEGLAEVAES